LLESLLDPCIGKARRFSYLVTDKAEQVKDQLLKEYRDSHGGNFPACMDKRMNDEYSLYITIAVGVEV
jgi:hypothetical protein